MEQENTLNISDYINIIKNRSRFIVVITLAAVVITSFVSFFILKPTYQAETSIIVGKPQTSTSSASSSSSDYTDVMMYQNLVKTYVQIAQSKLVAETALKSLPGSLTVGALQSYLTVTPQTGTQIITISTQSKDPQEAVDIINSVSDAFISQSKIVFPTGGDIQVMDKASLPTSPVKPNKTLNIAIAFFLGLMVSVGLTFLMDSMDSTIKTETDIEKYLGLPVIGIIPKKAIS